MFGHPAPVIGLQPVFCLKQWCLINVLFFFQYFAIHRKWMESVGLTTSPLQQSHSCMMFLVQRNRHVIWFQYLNSSRRLSPHSASEWSPIEVIDPLLLLQLSLHSKLPFLKSYSYFLWLKIPNKSNYITTFPIINIIHLVGKWINKYMDNIFFSMFHSKTEEAKGRESCNNFTFSACISSLDFLQYFSPELEFPRDDPLCVSLNDLELVNNSLTLHING